MKETEKWRDDWNRNCKAITELNSQKPRKPLAIFDNDITTIKYFQKLFSSNQLPRPVPPEKMDPSFTPDKIELSATKRLHWDRVHQTNHIKTHQLYQQIINILNTTSRIVSYPEDIRWGISNTPLPKVSKECQKVK